MFHLIGSVLFLLIVCLIVYYKREFILDHIPSSIRDHLPGSRRDYTLLPTTFQDQAAQGYSSAAFDLEANNSEDTRVGLDEDQLAEIREIMRRKRVNFDQARLIRQEREMIRHGIDPATGLPKDSRAITRL